VRVWASTPFKGRAGQPVVAVALETTREEVLYIDIAVAVSGSPPPQALRSTPMAAARLVRCKL